MIFFDTETWAIEPGILAPPLVCMSLCVDDNPAELLTRPFAIGCMRELLEGGSTFVGHNVAYDFAVFCAADPSLIFPIFQAYAEGRVLDTQIREQLRAIELGNLSQTKIGLGALASKYLDMKLDKSEDSYRTRYKELEGVPLDQWPDAAREYPLKDAEATRGVFNAQAAFCNNPDEEKRQCRAAFALHLAGVHGVRADGEAVSSLRATLEKEAATHEAELLASGILKVVTKNKKKGIQVISRDMAKIKALVSEALGEATPLTDTGRVSTARDTLLETGDPLLEKLADRGRVQKTLDFVPVLEKAVKTRFNPRWNVLKETGRTSCGSDEDPGNLQNQPRKGGVRECFIPEIGWVYIGGDYDTAELRALAQVCFAWFGFSKLRDAFLENKDPHLMLAATLMGLTYDEVKARYKADDPEAKKFRQFAKVGNFGFPGGLGIKTFVTYARGQGVIVDLERAQQIKDAWFATWTEMRPYFERIGALTSSGSGTVVQYRSNRARGNVAFCAAANSYFQGLIADGAKEALWRVTYECYCDITSPLFGSRPVIFAHDEIIAESPIDKYQAAGERLTQIMRDTLQEWIPDVPIKSSPYAMPRWFKDAKTKRDEKGRLTLWEPNESKAA